MRLELDFQFEKATKTKGRFAELGPPVEYGPRPVQPMANAVVGKLYVSHPALKRLGEPTYLRVTVEAADA